MPDDFDDDIKDPEPLRKNPRGEDEFAKVAADVLLDHINKFPEEVFYERQLQVIFEDAYFHWVTSRVLDNLAALKKVQSESLPLNSAIIRFFFSNKLRFWKRKAREKRALVLRYCEPDFNNAMGRQAEMLFDAALPKAGFMPVAQNTREYQGKVWEESKQNLDRIFVRDGIAYGAEVKNTLRYIEGKEFSAKLRMCLHLGLRPLFIARMMPKSYVWEVIEAGGYCLIFKYQLYPFGEFELAKMIRNKLQLPVDTPAAIYEGTITKFLNWHLRNPQSA
jgi:hypothetical protein